MGACQLLYRGSNVDGTLESQGDFDLWSFVGVPVGEFIQKLLRPCFVGGLVDF